MTQTQAKFDFNNLDLNLLRVFDVIMQERNLTRAADRLGKSVAGTSHALRRLRDELKDELFETPGRGMVPTRRALEIAPCIRECLGGLRYGLTSEPKFDPATAVRTFTIDLPVGADFVIAPPLMAHATRHAPGISFQIMSDRAQVLRSELRYGETELAIDYEPVDTEGLHAELLYSDNFFLMSRHDHPMIEPGRAIDIPLYNSLPQVQLTWTRTKGDSPLVHRLAKIGAERRVVMQVPTLGAVPAVIEVSDVVAAMSERVARNFARRWKIDLHALAVGLPPIPIYMVWHERFDTDPGHIWLRKAVKAACAAI